MPLSNATRRLATQFRIIFSELQAAHPVGSADGHASLQLFGRRYAAEMYLCAQQLLEEGQAAAGDDSAELQAELTRTQWAACILHQPRRLPGTATADGPTRFRRPAVSM